MLNSMVKIRLRMPRTTKERTPFRILVFVLGVSVFLYLPAVLSAQGTCNPDSTTSWRIVWQYDSEAATQDTITFFDIYKGLSSTGITNKIATVNVTVNEYRDEDIHPYTKYYYIIKARSAGGRTSIPSNIATGSIPYILDLDTLFIWADTSFNLSDPKYAVDQDYTTAQYKDSLTWLINDNTSYESPDQKLSVSINQQTDVVSFAVAQDWQGPNAVCLTVIDPDSFFYKKTVQIKKGVQPEYAPAVNNDAAQTTVNIPVTVNVLANDGPDADPSTVTVVANPAHGSISGVNSTDGRITYVPAQNYTGSDQFRYTVKGFNGLTSAQATVTVTISDVVLPVVSDDHVQTFENTAIVINVLSNDGTDVDPTTVAISSNPSHGSISGVSNSTGAVTYSPAHNFTGNDQFSYTVNGTNGAKSNPAQVTIAIIPRISTDIIAAPVPWRASVNEKISFTNLPESCSLEIYNIMGEPVFKMQGINSDTFDWDVKNNAKREISAGLYVFYVKNQSGDDVSSGKLIIIR